MTQSHVAAPPVPRAAETLAERARETPDPVERGVLLLRARLLAGPKPPPACSARTLLAYAEDGAGGAFPWLLLERIDEGERAGDAAGLAAARTFARFLAARCSDPRERADLEALAAPTGSAPAARRAAWLRLLDAADLSDAAAAARARAERCGDPPLAAAWAARALLLACAAPGGDVVAASRLAAETAQRAGAAALLRFANETATALGAPARAAVPETPPPAAAADTPVATLLRSASAADLPPPEAASATTPEALLEQASIVEREGRPAEAAALIERAARRIRDPERRAAAWFEHARIAHDALDNAPQALESLLVSFVGVPAVRTLDRLEQLYRSSGRLRELIGALDIAIEHRRSDFDTAEIEDLMLRKAQVLATELARPADAAAVLVEVVRLRPDDRYALDLLVTELASEVPRSVIETAVGIHAGSLPAAARDQLRHDPALAPFLPARS